MTAELWLEVDGSLVRSVAEVSEDTGWLYNMDNPFHSVFSSVIQGLLS